MRSAILLAAVVAVPCGGQTVADAPWMTGERLLALIAFPPPPGKSAERTHLDEQSARMYIHGVHDATEGKGWCYGDAGKPKPDVLEDAAMDGIKGLGRTQLKRNASDLIVEIWGNRYPCRAGKEHR